MPSTCTITARGLRVSFDGGHVALDDLHLDCPAGSFTSIVGPSGCGKSTLLRCISHLQPTTAGQLQLQTDSGDPRIAFVFQDPTLLAWRNVIENICLPLELDGQPRASRQVQAQSMLAQVGLTAADGGKFPEMLSGGMRMRVSLARALVQTPEVMLLDEPFAALDDISRQQLNEELLRLWQARQCTTLFVTHNVSEAVFLSERVLVMSRQPGRIVAEIKIDLPYPRRADLRETPEFVALTGTVGRSLREALA